MALIKAVSNKPQIRGFFIICPYYYWSEAWDRGTNTMLVGVSKYMNWPFCPGLPPLKDQTKFMPQSPQQNLPPKFVLISEIRPSFRHELFSFLLHFPSMQDGGIPQPCRVSLLMKCRLQPNLITWLHVEPLTLWSLVIYCGAEMTNLIKRCVLETRLPMAQEWDRAWPLIQ